MSFRRVVVSTYRWLGIVALAFSIVQAATGIFAMFHWEIDDAFVRGEYRPTDFNAIEQRLQGLEVNSTWTTAGAPDRYDVDLSDAVGIDDAGNVLRTRGR